VNRLGDNIDTIKKNTETLIAVSKEVDLEINVEKIKYMLLSRHQNGGKNRNIKNSKRLSENVSQVKYLGTTITNQNLIQVEIKSSNSGNVYCHLVQTLASSHLVSEIVKIRIYTTVILPVVLYGCET
jgi:hypothetical protein